MYRIGLLGASTQTGNMGVSALTASLVGLVRRHRADAEITLFIGSSTSDPERIRLGQAAVTVRVRNYRLSPQARPEEHLLVIALLACAWRMSPWRTLRRWIERRNSWIRDMIACRFVGDISGGDSFSDIYGFTRFLVTIAPALVAITLRRPLVLLPQTLGPYKHLLTRIISRAIILRARRVLCRDWDSVSLAKVVRRDDGDEVVHFCPDVAFALEPSEAPLSGIRPPVGAGTVAKLLGVNVNALMYHGGYGRGDMFGLRMDYEGFLRSLLCAVVRAGWTVILIPHNYGPPRGVNNDLDVCVDLAASAPSDVRRRLHVLAVRCGESELKAAIGLCSFFVGSRMHSCIASMSQGVPAVGVAYSHKFRGVFESVGMGDLVVDARRTTAEAALAFVLNMLEQKETLSRRLRQSIGEVRLTLERTVSTIMRGNGF